MLDITTQSEELTVERFNQKQDRVVRDFGYGDTAGALGIAKRNLKKLSDLVSLKITESKTLRDDTPEKQFCTVIKNLDSDVVALCALSSVLHAVAMGDKLQRATDYTGRAIAAECWAAGLLTANAALAGRITRAVKKKHGSLAYRRQAARSIAARAGYKAAQWTRTEYARAGGILIGWVLETLPDVFYLAEDEGFKYLAVTQGALDVATASLEHAMERDPVFLPTPEKPAPWTGYSTGGYWDERSRFRAAVVRTIFKETQTEVRAAIKDGSIQPHLDALNALQSVPWAINKPMLEIVKACQERGIAVKGLPSKDDVPAPSRVKSWEAMTDDEKKVWRRQASEIEKHNRSLIGGRVQFQRDMKTAAMMAEHPQFYTPFNSDWRGRVYAVCHFNFQRDDRVRCLFKFANGLPIGEDGLYWLKVHVANCGDFEKISKKPFGERVAWVMRNLLRIRSVAQTPLRDLWWTKADKPFLFLAACMELRDALAVGPQFVTQLPVSFDGSCSGLQHLCAMTRAPEGFLVNLTPNEQPQDVYQVVAEVAKKRIEADAAAGSELAKLALAFGITRKVVKRNVMTYSYSSKKFGMAKQQDEDLIEPMSFDVLAKKLPSHPFGIYADKEVVNEKGETKYLPTTPAAKYLAEVVYESIKEVVNLPQQAMVFLQKCARAMAHEGKPLTWTTPSGLPWANRYHVPKVKRIELWMHDTRIQLSVADGVEKEVDKDRAANGVAPNFVHALDAAHLALTVRAAAAEGIDAATVHDSFGCLAPHAARFNQIIREQFVGMYEKHDVLGEVLAQAKCALTLPNQQRLPKELEYGSLDIRAVLRAQYAFA